MEMGKTISQQTASIDKVKAIKKDDLDHFED